MKREAIRRHIIIAVHIIAAASVFLIFIMFSPPARGLREAEQRSDSIKASIASLSGNDNNPNSRRLRELAADYMKYRKKYEKLISEIPDSSGAGIIVKNLYRSADKLNVKVMYMETALPEWRGEYGQIPVKIQVAGGFYQMGAYIRSIERFDRLSRIDLIRIDAAEPGSSEISAELLIRVLVRKGW